MTAVAGEVGFVPANPSSDSQPFVSVQPAFAERMPADVDRPAEPAKPRAVTNNRMAAPR